MSLACAVQQEAKLRQAFDRCRILENEVSVLRCAALAPASAMHNVQSQSISGKLYR